MRRALSASTASTASRRIRRSARHYRRIFCIGTVTALNPVIGYEGSTELAAEAQKTGRGILELIREKKILTENQIAKVLRSGRDGGAGPSRHDFGRRAPRRSSWRSSSASWSLPARGEPPARDGGARSRRRGRFRGQRALLPTGGRRPPAIVHVTGPSGSHERRRARARLLRRGDRLRRRRKRIVGPRRLHRREGRPRAPPRSRPSPSARAARADGDDHGGYGEVMPGIEGASYFAWQYVVEAESDEISGRDRRTSRADAPGAADAEPPMNRARGRLAAPALWPSVSQSGSGPLPDGLTPPAWHLFAIFAATIAVRHRGRVPDPDGLGPGRRASPFSPAFCSPPGVRGVRQRDDPADRRSPSSSRAPS